MENRNYWVVSPNVYNDETQEDWKKCILSKGYAFVAYNTDHQLGKTFAQMSVGDCVIIAQGANSNKRFFAAGIVSSKPVWSKIEGAPGEAQNCKLNPFFSKDDLDISNEFGVENAYGASDQTVAIYQLKPFNQADRRIMNIVDHKLYIQDKVELLKSTKNLVLTGAPGTGKTYLAKQIAESIGAVEKFVQFHPSYDYTDFVEGLRPYEKGDGLGFKLEDGVFKKFCIEAKDNPAKNYVFIIDEINRGEISKIFGELFFSIEPNYRGVDGKVTTQFANIQAKKFDDGLEVGEFYVPENVYIIGTMNDIDRSVESFDFAMRRRFTWVEITAENSQRMFEGETWKVEAKDRMDRLNDVIWNDKTGKGIQGLNSSYHIGAAYFKTNLLKYTENQFGKLWEYHLEPLLKEYLRGRNDAGETLKNLENAYNLISVTNAN